MSAVQLNARQRQPARTSLEHALELLARGFAVIPVPYRRKKAVIKGWPRLRLRAEELSAHFDCDRTNIGVLTGEPSGWIVDVDLDHPFAVQLAAEFLPHTSMKWGRESKPCSHWLYRVTLPTKSKRWQLPSILCAGRSMRTVVELRSSDLQTVAPGSVHECGELVRWDSDGDPASVDPTLLREACAQLYEKVRARVEEEHRLTLVDPESPIDPEDPIDPIDPIRMTPQEVIALARVTGPGQHDTQTMNLARGLKLNARIESAEVARPQFAEWWKKSERHCNEQDEDAAFFKFERAWAKATVPLGQLGVAAAVLRAIDRVPHVPEAGQFGPRMARFTCALAEMGRRMPGLPFAISAHMVAIAFDCSPTTVQEWFNGLERRKLITVVDRGRPGANGTGRARRIIWNGCQLATHGVECSDGRTDTGDSQSDRNE